jgi:hypothetical protein
MTVASQAIREPALAAQVGVILREIVRGGLAGALAGMIVGGLGGRVVMRVAALLNPGATGQITGNGEVVGAITLNGTLALIMFGALGMGLVAGVVWVIVSPWLPRGGRRRWLLAAAATLAIGGFLLVEPFNPDFTILGPDPVILVLLLSLVAAMGASIAWFDRILEARLPPPGAGWGLLGYGIPAAIGALLVPPSLTVFLGQIVCFCAYPPELTGWALIGLGLITAAAWIWRIRFGRQDVPRVLLPIGRGGVVLAAALGTVSLATRVADILAGG